MNSENSFEDINEKLNLVISNLENKINVDDFDLSIKELESLESEISSLETMASKIEHSEDSKVSGTEVEAELNKLSNNFEKIKTELFEKCFEDAKNNFDLLKKICPEDILITFPLFDWLSVCKNKNIIYNFKEVTNRLSSNGKTSYFLKLLNAREQLNKLSLSDFFILADFKDVDFDKLVNKNNFIVDAIIFLKGLAAIEKKEQLGESDLNCFNMVLNKEHSIEFSNFLESLFLQVRGDNGYVSSSKSNVHKRFEKYVNVLLENNALKVADFFLSNIEKGLKIRVDYCVKNNFQASLSSVESDLLCFYEKTKTLKDFVDLEKSLKESVRKKITI